ncbi:MAG: hypothetical protein JSR60_02440 [Proteobacteria bacterium]|nr:hypothetical protein [Pseudomonadota bacterium]
MIRMLSLAAILAFGLGGCADLGLDDDIGFGDAPVASSNGCTAAGCPDAPRFCVARGYMQGTPAFDRCVASVSENLRKGGR